MKSNAIHTFQVTLEDCYYVENDSSQIIPKSFSSAGRSAGTNSQSTRKRHRTAYSRGSGLAGWGGAGGCSKGFLLRIQSMYLGHELHLSSLTGCALMRHFAFALK